MGKTRRSDFPKYMHLPLLIHVAYFNGTLTKFVAVQLTNKAEVLLEEIFNLAEEKWLGKIRNRVIRSSYFSKSFFHIMSYFILCVNL